MRIVAMYIRMPLGEIERLRDRPEVLPKYDPRVALGDGRGIDLGRAWEELGVFIDGGVRLPSIGPTVGDVALPSSDDRATWSYVEPERVRTYAETLAGLQGTEFRKAYDADSEDTADALPDERTDGWGDRATYLYKKLRLLAKHYADAAARADAMLVRIGEPF